MGFSITILGSSSATPIINRNPSAHVVNIHERLFLVDCAEGTQMQLLRYKIKFQRLHHIFISHLHGDHFFGLIGLISTLHLLGRKQPLTIYAPVGLEEIIDLQLKASDTTLQYPLIYHTIQPDFAGIIYKNDDISIIAFPLQHTIPTHGFIFKENPKTPKIKKDFVEEYKPDIHSIYQIKKGKDFIDSEGKLYLNQDITHEPAHSYSYAYCSDTRYDEKIIPFIKGVDLLYHEATFLSDRIENAHDKLHATAAEAAIIAKKAGVKQLLIGHYSARYREDEDLENFRREADEHFPNTILAKDGMTLQL
ncbi:MAG: ribonuclease Z [Bacteroidota bacterium]